MVSRKTITNFDIKIFRSESFSIRTYNGRAPASELVLLRGGLPSEIALQGGSLGSKIVSRGTCRLRKTKNTFSAHNEQGNIKREEKWFPEKTTKKIDLKFFFGPSHSRYVPIKAELPLPSSCC